MTNSQELHAIKEFKHGSGFCIDPSNVHVDNNVVSVVVFNGGNVWDLGVYSTNAGALLKQTSITENKCLHEDEN